MSAEAKKLAPLVETGDDLLPLAHPERLGLPHSRRTLHRLMSEGRFTQTIRIGGRQYITRAALEEYKAALIGKATTIPEK